MARMDRWSMDRDAEGTEFASMMARVGSGFFFKAFLP